MTDSRYFFTLALLAYLIGLTVLVIGLILAVGAGWALSVLGGTLLVTAYLCWGRVDGSTS